MEETAVSCLGKLHVILEALPPDDASEGSVDEVVSLITKIRGDIDCLSLIVHPSFIPISRCIFGDGQGALLDVLGPDPSRPIKKKKKHILTMHIGLSTLRLVDVHVFSGV